MPIKKKGQYTEIGEKEILHLFLERRRGKKLATNFKSMIRALHFERPLSKEVKNTVRDLVNVICQIDLVFPQIAANDINLL